MLAVSKGRLNIVRFLLEQDLQLDCVDNEKNTCSHIAAKYGYDEILQLLMNKNANLNLQN